MVGAEQLRNASITGFVLAFLASGALAQPRCSALEMLIRRVEPPPSQYALFCKRHPNDCILSGDAVLSTNPSLQELLFTINEAVNADVEFVPDMDRLGVAEQWEFPQNCQGDCEDFALEKRRRLVEAGLPSASLTMAIVHHEVQFFPHAVLLVETNTGTWVLDNLYDEVMCWDAVPYRFERREQPNGEWLRFAQF